MNSPAGIDLKGQTRRTWIALAALGLILLLGGFFRFDHITRQSFWLDEYSTLYLATGRGDTIYNLPLNTIIDPPYIGFTGAPGWWHIWNGMDSTSHPPGYQIMERWWVDVFGDGDWGLRALSTIASLIGVILLYAAVFRSTDSHWQALVAAGVLALAPAQIFYSQEARPYTLLESFGLIAVLIVLQIEKKGRTWVKLAALALTLTVMALTHYFSAGVIGAVFIYCLIRLRGAARTLTACTIVIAILIVTIAWTPNLIRYNRRHRIDDWGKTESHRTLVRSTLSVPNRLTFQYNYDPFFQVEDGPWYEVIALAIIVYLIPAIRFRTRPWLLIWWLWVVGEIGVIAMFDIARQSVLMSITRYVLLAGPGIYALLACPLPTRIGNWLPGIVLFGALMSAITYWQIGPRPTPDVRLIAQMVNQKIQPGDIAVFMGNFYTIRTEEPASDYAALCHYGVKWKTPVLFATDRLDEPTQRQLRTYRRVWVMGVHTDDLKNILPGWQMHDLQGPGNGYLLWSATPPS